MRRLWAPLAVVVGAAVCLAVLLAGVQSVTKAVEEPEQTRHADRVTVAKVAATGMRSWLARAKAEATGLAAQLQPWSGVRDEPVRARDILNRAVLATPSFDSGAIVVDRQFRVTASTANRAIVVGQVRRDPAIEAALAGQAVVSEVLTDPLERARQVLVVVPLRDARDQVTSALAAITRIPDGSLWQAVVDLQAGAGGPVVVVTRGGTVLDGQEGQTAGTESVGDALREPANAAGADGAAGLLEYEGEAGTPSAAAFASAGDGWRVVLPVPVEELDAGARAARRAAAMWLAPLLAIAFVVVCLLEWRRRITARGVDEAKRAFLAIANHELRTPLTVIAGLTRTLSGKWDRMPEAARREMVTTVGRQARNLEHLVERLLLGAQLEAGVTKGATLSSFDAVRLIEAAAAHHQSLSPAHRIEVRATPPIMVEGDRRGFDQVITNLVENAVKYSPEGGPVTIEAGRDGRLVRIVVDDEGIGLPGDTEAIFDKFVQREAVDTRVYDEGGVGLGLYIVRTLVRGMGGEVHAERRSKGARFVVTLKAPGDGKKEGV